MTNLQRMLSVLLVLQLAVAMVFFLLDRQGQRQYLQEESLLNFQQKQVDKVEISTANNTISLGKAGDSWQFPAQGHLPADHNKLNRLLSKLKGLKAGWPTATTRASHQRFAVAEGHFLRRLRLYKEDKLTETLFIGAAPRFRNAYVRHANNDAVYIAELSVHDLPVDMNAWLDKSLLAARDDIDTIQGPDYTIKKNTDHWKFLGRQYSEQEKEDALAKKQALALINLKIQQIAKTTASATTTKKNSIKIKVSGVGSDWVYEFSEVDNKYYVQRNDYNNTFLLKKIDYQHATGVDQEKKTSTNSSASKITK